MKHTEECGCGAKLTIEAEMTDQQVANTVAVWRRDHRCSKDPVYIPYYVPQPYNPWPYGPTITYTGDTTNTPSLGWCGEGGDFAGLPERLANAGGGGR